jgi:hypothetical protein
MAKHRKHKKNGSPQPDNREMFECEICKKLFPLEGYLPSPSSTPFLFLAIADPKDRRFSLAVVMGEEIQMTKTEVQMWFVCSDRQCIHKSFLMWRVWDTRKQTELAAMEQIDHVEQILKSKGESALEQDLDEILEHGIIQRRRSFFESEQPDEKAAGSAEVSTESQP